MTRLGFRVSWVLVGAAVLALRLWQRVRLASRSAMKLPRPYRGSGGLPEPLVFLASWSLIAAAVLAVRLWQRVRFGRGAAALRPAHAGAS